MKVGFWLCAAGAAVMCASTAALAGGTLYTVREGDNVLQRIDLDTLTFTDIGPLGVVYDFGGMTYNTDNNTLYMVNGRGGRMGLYTVDTNSGNATLVGVHGIVDLFGLAYDNSTGTMYATQFSGGRGFYSLNISNGSPTTINGAMTRGIGGLTYVSSTDQLIGVNDGSGNLYDIDRSNGNQTFIFSGGSNNDSGLVYDPERNGLWNIDWNGNLYFYDIANGYARTTVLTGLGAHDGLAYVPAPASFVLLGLGGLAGATRRRRG